MKRREPEDAYAPFVRPAERWRAMGAPRFMWDDDEALRVARAAHRPGYRLDGFGTAGERHMVRRIRHQLAAAVLHRCGQLSREERARIDRRPKFYPLHEAPRVWLPGVSIDDVIAGRIGGSVDAA